MLSKLSYWLLFRVLAWRVTGRYPYEVPKLVLIVAPHTSNWDFPIGVLVRSALNINAWFVGKHTLFVGPLGPLMRWLRGMPVDRRKRGNFVDSAAALFEQNEYLHLVIAPEGTRKKVDRFKTGFYHIARKAGVPILLCAFDWENKIIHFEPQLFYPGTNEEEDMAFLWNYFKKYKGYAPEKGVL